jgi:ParB-like chromosome segregation protein Spo0J
MGKKRGRKQLKFSDATRRRVEIAAGGGISQEQIALMLGISRTTLLKHFEHELGAGALARREEVLAAMYRAAKKGSTASARLYLTHTQGKFSEQEIEEQPVRPSPEGKKAQAQAAAKTAQHGTEWEDLLKPPPSIQ